MSAHGRVGQGHYINPFLARAKREKKSRAKKITEARRVGAPRWSSEAAAGGPANTLTIFFEMRSNFSKNERLIFNLY